MKTTDKAIAAYGLDGYTLMTSSSSTMLASLKKAMDKGEWIVITGWTPHWMFDQFDLKFLDDPKKVYGDLEEIHAIARKGFSEKDPFAAEFFGNIKQYYLFPTRVHVYFIFKIKNNNAPIYLFSDFGIQLSTNCRCSSLHLRAISSSSIRASFIAVIKELSSSVVSLMLPKNSAANGSFSESFPCNSMYFFRNSGN